MAHTRYATQLLKDLRTINVAQAQNDIQSVTRLVQRITGSVAEIDEAIKNFNARGDGDDLVVDTDVLYGYLLAMSRMRRDVAIELKRIDNKIEAELAGYRGKVF